MAVAARPGSPWIVRLARVGRSAFTTLPGDEPGSIWMVSPAESPGVVRAVCKAAKVVWLSTGTAIGTTKRLLSSVRSSSASTAGRLRGTRWARRRQTLFSLSTSNERANRRMETSRDLDEFFRRRAAGVGFLKQNPWAERVQFPESGNGFLSLRCVRVESSRSLRTVCQSHVTQVGDWWKNAAFVPGMAGKALERDGSVPLLARPGRAVA